MIGSVAAVLIFIAIIIAGICVLRWRRNQRSSSAGNVIYVNSDVTNQAELSPPSRPAYLPNKEHNIKTPVTSPELEDPIYGSIDDITYHYATTLYLE